MAGKTKILPKKKTGKRVVKAKKPVKKVSVKQKETRGRKPLFETPEQMQKSIELYFQTTDGKKTITGLAYHLGFESRQSFYDYEKDTLFSYIIKRARLRIEMIYEGILQGNNSTGSIFALKNLGWKDESNIDLSNKGEKFESIDYSKLSDATIRELLAASKPQKTEG